MKTIASVFGICIGVVAATSLGCAMEQN